MTVFGINIENAGNQLPSKIEDIGDEEITLNRGTREEEFAKAALAAANELANKFWPDKIVTVSVHGAADPAADEDPSEGIAIALTHRLSHDDRLPLEVERRANQIATQREDSIQEAAPAVIAEASEFPRGESLPDTSTPPR